MEKRFLLFDDDLLQKQRQLIKEDIKELLKDIGNVQASDEVLNSKDVCRLLKRSRQTIENWSKEGKLKKRMLGDSIFFLRSEVLASLKVKSESKNNNSIKVK